MAASSSISPLAKYKLVFLGDQVRRESPARPRAAQELSLGRCSRLPMLPRCPERGQDVHHHALRLRQVRLLLSGLQRLRARRLVPALG